MEVRSEGSRYQADHLDVAVFDVVVDVCEFAGTDFQVILFQYQATAPDGKEALDQRYQQPDCRQRNPYPQTGMDQYDRGCKGNQQVQSYDTSHQAIAGTGGDNLRRGPIALSQPPVQEVGCCIRTVYSHVRPRFLIGSVECLFQHDGASMQPFFQKIPFHINRTDLIAPEAVAVAGNESALKEQLAACHLHFHIGIAQKHLAYPQQQYEQIKDCRDSEPEGRLERQRTGVSIHIIDGMAYGMVVHRSHGIVNRSQCGKEHGHALKMVLAERTFY